MLKGMRNLDLICLEMELQSILATRAGKDPRF